MQLKQDTRAYVALVVSDLDRALRFYCDVLGFEPIKEVVVSDEKASAGQFSNKGFEFVTVANGPYAIKLVRTKAEPAVTTGVVDDFLGVRYLGFEVRDFERTAQSLRERGVEFLSEPLVPEQANNIPPLVFFRDPDGNLLEIAG